MALRRGRLAAVVLAAALVSALVTVAPLAAQTYDFGEIEIRDLPDLPAGVTHGYFEHTFLATNRSSRPHRVDLAVDRSSPGSALRRLSREVEVAPGSSAELSLLQPPASIYQAGVLVRIDGRVQSERMTLAVGTHPELWGAVGAGQMLARRILVSQRVSAADFPAVDPDLEFRLLQAVMPVTGWSDAWLAYSGYDGIVLHADDLAGLPAGVLGAVRRYVETGGSLLVAAAGDEGLGAVFDGATFRPRAGRRFGRLRVSDAGLGTVIVSQTPLDGLAADDWKRIEDDWKRSREPWSLLGEPQTAHALMPVIDKIEIPVRALFLVVLVFALVVGPVNVAVLTRRRKRMWILWTVPAAALLTSFAVFLFAMFGEGLRRERRATGLTVLDQRTHRAASVGWLGYYSTLTPAAGLTFDRDTEVSPLAQDLTGTGPGGTVDWSQTQHFAEGWIAARWPAYFVVRKSEVRRERLSVRRRDDGTFEVTNGLGVDLEALWLADETGAMHTLDGTLAAGAAARLRPTATLAVGQAGQVRAEVYRSDLPSRLQHVAENPEESLIPGTYLARTAASPFVEEGLAGVARARLDWTIYGVLGGGE